MYCLTGDVSFYFGYRKSLLSYRRLARRITGNCRESDVHYDGKNHWLSSGLSGDIACECILDLVFNV